MFSGETNVSRHIHAHTTPARSPALNFHQHNCTKRSAFAHSILLTLSMLRGGKEKVRRKVFWNASRKRRKRNKWVKRLMMEGRSEIKLKTKHQMATRRISFHSFTFLFSFSFETKQPNRQLMLSHGDRHQWFFVLILLLSRRMEKYPGDVWKESFDNGSHSGCDEIPNKNLLFPSRKFKPNKRGKFSIENVW